VTVQDGGLLMSPKTLVDKPAKPKEGGTNRCVD